MTKYVTIQKRELVRLLNTVLETTGCREICRQCNTRKFVIRIGTRTYGVPKGGCCSECHYLTERGCLAKKQKSLYCLFYTCPSTRKRLDEFGLGEWFSGMFNRTRAHGVDFRSPYRIKMNEPVRVYEVYKGRTKW